MILPDFILQDRANQHWSYSGLDDLNKAIDKSHFKDYPYPVSYNYNSRGFRDSEWPDDLKDSIWCFGDSFTVGIGGPVTHNWSNLLETKLAKKCINISMDGASNEWIARKVLRVLEEIQPQLIIIHWSFVWRIESPDINQSDEKRRKHFLQGEEFPNSMKRFVSAVQSVEYDKNNTKVIHSSIPGFTNYTLNSLDSIWHLSKGVSWPDRAITNLEDFNNLATFIKDELKEFINITAEDFLLYETEMNKLYNISKWIKPFKQLDVSRDGYHYDKLTANAFVDQILELI
jgi:hypothetical protein